MAINSTSKTILSLIASKPENDFNFFILLLSAALPYSTDNRKSFFQGTFDYDQFEGLNGSDIIFLDESDQYSVDSYNKLIAQFLNVSVENLLSLNATNLNSVYNNKLTSIEKNSGSFSTLADVRKNFVDQELVFYKPDGIGATYALLSAFAGMCKQRCQIWRAYYTKDGFTSFIDSELVAEEVRDLSETEAEEVLNSSDGGLENLTAIYSKLVTSPDSNYFMKVGSQQLLNAAFGDRERSVSSTNAFYRTFTNINPQALELSPDILSELFSKLEASGLLNLAAYAYEIGEFVKRRFVNKQRLQRGVFEPDGTSMVIDEKYDLPWLITMSSVIQRLKKDPITFAAVNYYFPSLVTFLIDAISAIGDYSNNGRGSEDAETADAFLNSLEKVFGLTLDGKPLFTLALRASTTSQRIKQVLSNSPFNAFRDSIAPANPDIFHLRLGAANFYVPPVGIDVNTMFKTGSLVGGAIRQKNTPKFNSGYRETSIRMRLFFPNYEEIWGISIDDGSSISVNENYEIDFKRGGSSEEKIDKFLSSLRGLVAAFKYSPILPIKNHYINTVHNISGVCLSNMTISTVPNFPFVLAVDLELLNFNHSPFLPMIKDFNQTVHWGKYRQYMGKAAGSLHSYVNEGFLLKTSDNKDADIDGYETTDDEIGSIGSIYGDEIDDIQNNSSLVADNVYKNDVYTQNVKKEWEDGNHIVFYAPAETQTKIFLPDTSSFRTEQEKLLTDLGSDFWEGMLTKLGINIDINQSAGYRISLPDVVNLSQNNLFPKNDFLLVKDYVSLLTAGANTDENSRKAYLTLMTSFIQQNSTKLDKERKEWLLDYDSGTSEYPAIENTYYYNDIILSGVSQASGDDLPGISLNEIKAGFKQMAVSPQQFLNFITNQKIADIEKRLGASPDEESVREGIARAFNVSLYRTFFKLGSVRDVMEARRAKNGYRFQEWEVPMIKVELDPKSVIINSVTVSIGNNFAKLQLQMQDEPSYQHIGGKDSYVNISMTVIGEKELIKLRSMFDHISGLARLEHATGVIGFLGIKNIVTALCGIKYILPLSYRVNTIPNYPHVYSVEISMVDFDIFQQKRESLSSKQQTDLVTEFKTKKNPFLRIKQLWGNFNAYPDFPLQVKDEDGETVGHLDPDFYFRSFEMFDRDVINSVTDQTPRVQDYIFDNGIDSVDVGLVANISAKILEFLRQYSTLGGNSLDQENQSLIDLIQEMREYVRTNNISHSDFIRVFNSLISTNTDGFTTDTKNQLLTNFLIISDDASETNPYLLEINPTQFKQGDLSPNAFDLRMAIEAMLSGEYSLQNEEFISFDPDEVDFHKLIHLFPQNDPEEAALGRVQATCITAIGTYFGYVQKDTGRFYLTYNGTNARKNPETGDISFTPNLMDDTQTPDKGNTVSNTGVPGTTALSDYQKAYEGGLYGHLEKMMVDTSYRDISGRMLRAFPTYMLWLIDEGGYFAGAKLFDNFYGLQSVIDFSVVSSEDLLGDTLILRISNLYAKLTSPPMTEILNPNIDMETGTGVELIDSVEAIVARTLNFSRNILSHMRNEFVSDFSSIRLKPGVRLHLRAGYGANPNSLQTIFNGTITNVEPGEIVTITAQSDAIELGAVINSADKKGDSGKIDGGMMNGLWLSEPRDLMVRLLSMGASRVREAFARAYKGTIFSENRFGIRHFGSILYEPTEMENNRNRAIRDSVSAAFIAGGSNQSFSSKALDVTSGFSFNTRGNTFSAMYQIWSNFSAEIDLEVFKRNIYPGNGTGIAQFMGGDLDDGWLTAATIVPEDNTNSRIDNNLGRLTDLAWNNLVTQAGQRVPEANEALDSLTEDNKLVASDGAGIPKLLFGGALTVGATALGGPVVGTIIGAGLLGILRGRGGTNIFRTLGLVSANPDDDIPGFDEVSFRAQTYMRTVWDMFQTCARLLPNYIVAVRPFEDRSTIFYGKPHWLYTSGVVPVTTGFPGDDKMDEALPADLRGQRLRNPDDALQEILDVINRDSNSYADYNAYFESFEKDKLFDTLSSDMMQSEGVYAPTSFVSGKIIDFYSNPATTYYAPNNQPVAKMPKTFGKVTVGLHLPITSNNATEADLNTQSMHKQLANLPPRFRHPFFAATESLVLERNSEFVMTGIRNEFNTELFGAISRLTAIENQWFFDNQITLKPTSETLQLDTVLNLDPLIQKSAGIAQVAEIIRMPIPNIVDNYNKSLAYAVVSPDAVTADYAFEYQPEVYGQLTYSEWGSPETPEDEQFYIAMRWPYIPENQEIRSQFISKYFSGVTYLGEQNGETVTESTDDGSAGELYGTAADYKQRKVLIYSPGTNRAVVCRPAYFMWGEADDIDAVVSPDAAYYLGILTLDSNDEVDLDPEANFAEKVVGGLYAVGGFIDAFRKLDNPFNRAIDEFQGVMDWSTGWDSGFRSYPSPQQCYMGFVPDSVPVGVVASATTPVNKFSLSNSSGEAIEDDTSYLIGFGRINSGVDGNSPDVFMAYGHATNRAASVRNSLEIYRPYQVEFQNFGDTIAYGGNPLNVGNNKTYFEATLKGEYSSLERSNLNTIMNEEIENYPDVFSGGRSAFVPVSSPVDEVGIQARRFFDEDFDPEVNVIAGNGRTIDQAVEIWNEFRTGYHTFDSVKAIFKQVYGLDPDSEDVLPSYMSSLILGGEVATDAIISKFNTGENTTALDEFAVLLGSDYVDSLPSTAAIPLLSQQDQFKQAIEFARENLIDAPASENGIIEYFNNTILQLKNVYENFISEDVIQTVLIPSGETDTVADGEDTASTSIDNFDPLTITPKQLFLLMVGIFRQRLWEDPFARAWLVLKPSRKRSMFKIGGGDEDEGYWSFKPVDKVFREFINPYNDMAKPSKKQKFIQLLAATKSEGNSDTNLIADAITGIGNFFETNIGPIWSALTDSLSALLGMFKLNMQQMGYALSEVGRFGMQANIMNKALNDSIYYSLGRPGSILRAVDNPFTREYGEPVIEIREPFQRVHYLNSFSHILNNKIQENLNNVATVVTAVSDGKYPVTVALDKGAPAERQTEKTVETGIYFDNHIGSGLTGVLHPLFHPIETARATIKNVTGTPDELLARRVALAHLKESIKDIYGGEVLVIGNADIRPHDLIYIADIYERMYGMFEVEQVIHHFTPELGFITAVTPNALVTVNDPARWFISSWIDSWFNVQTIRNDTRMYMENIRSANSGISVAGNISMDALGEALAPQITGGMQFTHGSSALSKDLIANQMAQSLPDSKAQLVGASKDGLEGGVRAINMIAGGIASAAPIIGQLAWKGWKYVRDNLLDQHGCYVQYLNKNGQPMDAGLSYNQGMVVGRYHTKAMLPGILGVRSKVRTPDGYAYIRSDDLLKSLGWQEKDVTGLVRYLSYENALVHARVLKLAGLGPEKAGLQPQYKLICKVSKVIDGDTLKLVDCITGSNLEFNIRFTGVDTSELNNIQGKVDFDEPQDDVSIIDVSSPAGKAKVFVENALNNKIFIVTVSPKAQGSAALVEADYYPGATANNTASYDKDQFNRVLGTIFYYFPQQIVNQNIQKIESLIRNKIISARYENPQYQLFDVVTVSNMKEWFKESFDSESIFRTKFDQIYNATETTIIENYFNFSTSNDVFGLFDESLKKTFNTMVYISNIDWIYSKTNEWPLVSWDEYYEDGYPATLNWELVVNNLARVYVKDLQRESDSVIGIDDGSGVPVNVLDQ